MTDNTPTPPETDEPDDDTFDHEAGIDDFGDDTAPGDDGSAVPAPPRPVNWDLLSPSDAEHEWLTLNEWVHWLRKTFSLTAAVVPPLWHRHPELVWELSALHTHWLGAYDAEQDGSAPLGWLTDFAVSRERLREWVNLAGTRLRTDRPSRQAIWPGEDPAPEPRDTPIENREDDFYTFVRADVQRRQELIEELRALRGDYGTYPESRDTGDSPE